MNIRWLLHARHTMAERSIREQWVMETLSSPGYTTTDPRDATVIRAFRQIEEYDGRWLRVVFRETSSDLQVITVFFDRNAGKQP